MHAETTSNTGTPSVGSAVTLQQRHGSDLRGGEQRTEMGTDTVFDPGPHTDRLIIVCTMSYKHIFRRPNLARTAAQLHQAGRVLWIIIEDTHSLRKMATSRQHYQWIVDDTRAFVSSLGLDTVYIATDSPFPENSPRSPKIETYQRNLGLDYAYSVVDNVTTQRRHGLTDCKLGGDAGERIRMDLREGKRQVSASDASMLFGCPVGMLFTLHLNSPAQNGLISATVLHLDVSLIGL